MVTTARPSAPPIPDPAANPDWLALAHTHSTVLWYPTLMPLDALGMWRVDDHPGNGYQRPLSERTVQQILANFDSGEARDIYVSQRTDGTLWILDGQHTVAALRKLGFQQWPCRVFHRLSIEAEAIWFDRLNNNSRKIPAVVDHNAKVVSDTDPISLVIDATLERYFLRIASSKIRNQDGRISFSSPSVFRYIVSLGGEGLLDNVLGICVDSWGHNRDSFPSRIMVGLAYFLAWIDRPLDRSRMLAMLKNTTPRQLIESIGSTGSGGAPGRSAAALRHAYVSGVPAQGFPRLTGAAVPEVVDPRLGVSRSSGFWTPETERSGRVELHPWYPPETSSKSRVVREVSEDVTAAVAAAVEASLGAQGRPDAEPAVVEVVVVDDVVWEEE